MEKKSPGFLRKVLKLVGLLIVIGFVMSRFGGCMSRDLRGPKDIMVNRFWVHHMPKDDRDLVSWMVLSEKDKKHVGGVGFSSQWRGVFENYRWTLSGDKLKVDFPQNKIRAEVQVKAWECKREAPKPFEYCLELKQGIRLARFYSKKDWKLGGEIPADLSEHPQLRNAWGAAPDANASVEVAEPTVPGELPAIFFQSRNNHR